jgi:uncharacterized delta-60 repeat protein
MARITSVTQRQLTVTAPDQSLELVKSRLTFATGTGFNGEIRAIVIQPDGKILAVGSFTTYNEVAQNRIIRLNADGTRDTSFVIGTGFNGSPYAMALQTDGKILAVGTFTSYNGVAQNRIIRLNADGTHDTSFVIGTGFNMTVWSIAVQTDGKILVGGDITAYNGTTFQYKITRLNADGTIDTGFLMAGGFTNGAVYTIAVQPDGKILVGGGFGLFDGIARGRITRLNADGTPDAGFVVGDNGFTGGPVWDIAVQLDGKIVVVGNFTAYNGVQQNRIARLSSSGTLEFGLNFGYNIGNGFSGSLLDAFAVAIQLDGKIVVGGGFIQLNSFTVNRIARLNADGTRDTSFVMNLGVNSVNPRVYAVAVQPDGKILIGGDFTAYNSVTQNRITRLLTSGELQPTTLPGSA